MDVLLMVLGSGLVLVAAYFTIGTWLARRVFRLDNVNVTPAVELRDGTNVVPTRKWIVFGSHFASMGGAGVVVGGAIAVQWGWLPALVWVVVGSILIGGVQAIGAVVMSMRNTGRSISEVAGEMWGRRVQLLILAVLVFALWLAMAVFSMVCANVLRLNPSAIAAFLVVTPLAMVVGALGRAGRIPVALAVILTVGVVCASAIYADVGAIQEFNAWMAALPMGVWIIGMLAFAYLSGVVPASVVLWPKNCLTGCSMLVMMAVMVIGVCVAAVRFAGSNANSLSPDEYAPLLSLVAPMVDWHPEWAGALLPILFVTIVGSVCHGFQHSLKSGMASKHIAKDRDVNAFGFGPVMCLAFLGVVVVAACAGGIGLGIPIRLETGSFHSSGTNFYSLTTLDLGLSAKVPRRTVITTLSEGEMSPRAFKPGFLKDAERRLLSTYIHDLGTGPLQSYGSYGDGSLTADKVGQSLTVTTMRDGEKVKVEPIAELPDEQGLSWFPVDGGGCRVSEDGLSLIVAGNPSFTAQYQSWPMFSDVEIVAGTFIEGAANFLAALRIPREVAVVLLVVMVASSAATTLDTVCRVQRNAFQELGRLVLIGRRKRHHVGACPECGYDVSNLATDGDESRVLCPECGTTSTQSQRESEGVAKAAVARAKWWNPFKWLTLAPVATVLAVIPGGVVAFQPYIGRPWSLENAGVRAMVVWPMLGAVNLLLGGFVCVVIVAWLRMTKRPWWFAVVPAIVMLGLPAWALVWKVFVGNADNPSWMVNRQWEYVGVGCAALLLEAWLVIEVMVRWKQGSAASPLGGEVGTSGASAGCRVRGS